MLLKNYYYYLYNRVVLPNHINLGEESVQNQLLITSRLARFMY